MYKVICAQLVLLKDEKIWTEEEKRQYKNRDSLEEMIHELVQEKKIFVSFTRSFSINEKQLASEKMIILESPRESSKESGIIIQPPAKKGFIINPELREAVVGSFTGSIQREKDMVEWMAKSFS